MVNDIQIRMFLQNYAKNPNVEWAAKQAGISRSTVYRLRTSDPAFCREMDLGKALWRNGLIEKAENKLGELVEKGTWSAIRYALDKYHTRYPSASETEEFEKRFPDEEQADVEMPAAIETNMETLIPAAFRKA